MREVQVSKPKHNLQSIGIVSRESREEREGTLANGDFLRELRETWDRKNGFAVFALCEKF